MSEAAIIVAHLSDLHLGPLPQIPFEELNVKRLTGWMNWHRKRRYLHSPATANRLVQDVVAQNPTHIAVTGDLANLGLPTEIDRAAQWLRRLGEPARVSVVPGNHDIYSTVGGANRGPAALAAWSAYIAPDALGARYCDGGAFPFVRVLQRGAVRVALIGLNSAVETPPMIATGRLGAAQLRRLADSLDATHRDGLLRVVMLHHPPLPGGAMPRHELTDAAALADVFSAHGAELVIHGHNHRRSIEAFDGAHGRFAIVGVPSASVHGRAPHGDELARAHFFRFTMSSDGRPRIELSARGIARADGPVVELERRSLDALLT